MANARARGSNAHARLPSVPTPGQGILVGLVGRERGKREEREDGKATMLIWCVDSVMVTE